MSDKFAGTKPLPEVLAEQAARAAQAAQAVKDAETALKKLKEAAKEAAGNVTSSADPTKLPRFHKDGTMLRVNMAGKPIDANGAVVDENNLATLADHTAAIKIAYAAIRTADAADEDAREKRDWQFCVRLAQLRPKVPHGQWYPWLAANMPGVSTSQVSRYLAIGKHPTPEAAIEERNTQRREAFKAAAKAEADKAEADRAAKARSNSAPEAAAKAEADRAEAAAKSAHLDRGAPVRPMTMADAVEAFTDPVPVNPISYSIGSVVTGYDAGPVDEAGGYDAALADLTDTERKAWDKLRATLDDLKPAMLAVVRTYLAMEAATAEQF